MQNAGLNCRADRYYFIGVNAFVRFFPEQRFYRFLNRGHARLAADQDYFIDIRKLKTGAFGSGSGHCLAGKLDRMIDIIFHKAFEFRARKLQKEMLRTGRIGRNIRKINFRFKRGRKLVLRLFRALLEALERERVL